MKKSILILTTLTLITGAIVTSCNTPAQKVEDAQKNVIEANKDLNEANEEYLAEIESYRKVAEDKIAANDRIIADFNSRIEQEKQDVKADYKKKIVLLEQRNSDIKKKLDDFKADGKEKWESFKAEFNRDMDELGNAFKDFIVKNNK